MVFHDVNAEFYVVVGPLALTPLSATRPLHPLPYRCIVVRCQRDREHFFFRNDCCRRIEGGILLHSPNAFTPWAQGAASFWVNCARVGI